MRFDSAHRKAWGLAAVLLVCAVVAAWVTGVLDVGWVIRVSLILAVATLLAVGFTLRQRALDELAMARMLDDRLNREMSGLTK